MKTFPLFIMVLSLPLHMLHAQQGGNSLYGQNYDYGKEDVSGQLYLSDSTFIIEGSVLLNVIADEYVVTFGVEEEASTVKECNDKMEKRIQSFTADLIKSGIPAADMYVDMTTQNKIYDFKVNGDVADQYLKGFELKKNVNIRFRNIRSLDDMIIAASDHQIYDLVKVDYLVTNLADIYVKLFQAANDVIQQKKDLYTRATNAKVLPVSQVYGEQFYSYYPTQLYKSYTAYSSSEIYTNAETIREVRKSPTYYYDKINYSGFDRVINPAVTEPAVEFVLTLRMKFETE